ncbi:MAG: DUF1573 domain-containing protein [Firmicutes bacterium]|nr:DUF1573 domain-containing protein [Bacillota bacterium]MDD4263733.1 DUF1573 domain-containing protein [Bacillota bacterium]MDD4693086.1 DUF1573 domain-containing protein [Bacillota bacterium]
MDNFAEQDFQELVDKYLIRHRSILDIVTKLSESTARTNRALAKAVTICGCIRVSAKKQSFPSDINYSDLRSYMEDHIEGRLCESCQEVLENEIGRTIFYLAALSDTLDLDLNEIIKKERLKLEALGVFNLT